MAADHFIRNGKFVFIIKSNCSVKKGLLNPLASHDIKFLICFISAIVLLFSTCNEQETVPSGVDSCQVPNGNYLAGKAALLASRIKNLQELKSIVQLDYYRGSVISDSTDLEVDRVQIEQCVGGQKVISVLELGISQKEIAAAEKGDVWDKANVLIQSPYTVQQRSKLKSINLLARRRSDLFGPADVAFYDLAEHTVIKIRNKKQAYLSPRDNGEKGYINSFNHVTAQALITIIYDEEVADFIADVHERYNMPGLIQGSFSEQQMNDPNNNPIDNYVDMLNNEWGQKLGEQIKAKYKISRKTNWDPEFLASYLNEIQHFYSWAFDLEMEPFRAEEEVIQLFCNKLNRVLKKK